MKLINIKCKNCGKEISVRKTEIKRGNGKFCSISCSAKFQHKNKPKKKSNTVCAKCGKKFYKRPSSKKNSKSGLYFCSRKCKDEAQRIGGIKEIQPNHYGSTIKNYRSIQKYENKLNECEICGYDKIPEILEVHHIDRNRKNNKKENLITLCPNCHKEEHFKAKDGLWKIKQKQIT